MGSHSKTAASQLVSLLLMVAFACLGISGAPAVASVGDKPLDSLYHTRWTAREGVPSHINTMVQTADGYLWLGTTSGLFRFDGVSFKLFTPTSRNDLAHSSVTSLLVARSGGLWISYEGADVSAAFLKDGTFTPVPPSPEVPSETIIRMAEAPDGTVWASTQYGILRLEDFTWREIGLHSHYPYTHPDTVFIDRRGTVWASTRRGLVFSLRGQTPFQVADTAVSINVNLAEDPDGGVWEASTNGYVRRITTADGHLVTHFTPIRVNSEGIAFSRDGALWIMTVGHGLWRVPGAAANLGGFHSQASVDHFYERDGLTSDFGWFAMQDMEGSMWVLTSKGLDEFRASALTPIRLADHSTYISLLADPSGGVFIGSELLMLTRRGVVSRLISPPGRVECQYRDLTGGVWMGGFAGLWQFKGDRFVEHSLPRDLNPHGHNVQTMTSDKEGSLWVSFERSGLYRFAKGSWAAAGSVSSLSALPPLFAYTDPQDRLWFGYSGNRLSSLSGSTVRNFAASDGLDIGNVLSILEHEGKIWVAGDTGLEFLSSGQFRRISLNSGEKLFGVSGMVFDTRGDIWLNTLAGIYHITSSEIQRAQRDSSYGVRFELLNYLDGIVSGPEQIRPLPTAIEDTEHRLYFATRASTLWIDPTSRATNAIVSPVEITSLNADGHDNVDLKHLTLAANTQSVAIRYTAASLLIPERVKFRYLLEGLDKHWSNATPRREVTYSRLPPGKYTFRVSASNNDGIWNNAVSSVVFVIPPAFYQSVWFRLCCAALLLAGAWLVMAARVRHATEAVQSRLAERMRERERIARELHDTLLQGFHGLMLRFQVAVQLLPKLDPAHPILDDALNRADALMSESRDRIRNLRYEAENAVPLTEALSSFGEAIQKEVSVDFKVLVEGRPVELVPLIQEEVYFIGREALLNAFRHSRGRLVELEIDFESTYLRMRIRDDGIGLEPEAVRTKGMSGHWGLSGMYERAAAIGAHLSVWNRRGSGCELELQIAGTLIYKTAPLLSRWRRVGSFLRRLMHGTSE